MVQDSSHLIGQCITRKVTEAASLFYLFGTKSDSDSEENLQFAASVLGQYSCSQGWFKPVVNEIYK